MSVHTSYYKSPIGTLILECDDENITAILFANSYKGKNIDEETLDYAVPDSPILQKCINQLNEYFDGKRKTFDLPIKHSGTNFQVNVWQKLLDIPYGKLISYMDLSKKVDNVKAIRAVGQTNGN